MVVVVKGEKQYGNLQSLTEEFLENQDGVEQLASDLRESLTALHALQERFEKAVKKQSKTLGNIEKAANSLKRVVRTKTTSDAAGTSNGEAIGSSARIDYDRELDLASAEDLRRRLERSELQHLMPCSGGLFVELLLGKLNVRFMRKSERLQFKESYERLKLKLAPGLVVLAVVSLVFSENRWVHMVLQLCLVWYYVTLAVRENILRVNGSNIKSWWIVHHYFTMAQCVLLLTWPNNASYAAFRKSLHLFGLYNAVLQIFQTRYQVARLYALRSLGKASEMDVAASDSTQIHWSRGMATLLPLILLGQAIQAWMAAKLAFLFRDNKHEWQIFMLAVLFAANFFGNFSTTMVVLYEKRGQKRPRKDD